MKISIIGYSGSGKSTLADKLATYYSIPKLHIDTLQFQPGWQESNRDWMLKEMQTFLAKNENWVIDGNYTWCCYEERMEEADQIIFLNFFVLVLSFLEPLDAISNIEAKLEKAWQLAALNNSTGSLSAGFSGMVVALYTKISTKEFVSIILEKLRLLTIKEN